MTINWFSESDDLITNPSPRIPICLCLDTSFSMDGEPINELNRAIEIFYKEISTDIQTAASCEISIVSFDNDAKLIDDFSLIHNKKFIPLRTNGSTNMKAGIELALKVLNRRKESYKENGVDYYQPWLIIMSDGRPDNRNGLLDLQSTIRTMESKRKIMVLPVGIGSEADLEVLSLFSNKNPGAFSLKGLNFKEFFNFISKSMESISRSKTDDRFKLPVELINEWADL
jgi:uncharacterized protein YegL